MKKIAVIGSTMMDVVSYTDRMPAAGETRRSTGFHIAAGGKGANQAVAAASLGASVMMVTAVGDDLFGENSLANFQTHHIDTQHIMTIPETPNGVASITVEESGQNRILIHEGANGKFTPERLAEAEEELAQCALVVLQLEIPLPTVYAAIDFAHKHAIPIILNPAPAAQELSLEKICQCDFLMPNESELSLITGMPTDSLEEIRAAAQSLLVRGIKNVIVTMGCRGAVWINADQETIVSASKVKAVDTTGAGDAFIGCFAASYVNNGNIKEAIEKASRYATLSVTREGTQDSYADVADFTEYMKSHPVTM